MMAGGEGMDMTSGSEDGDDDEGEPFCYGGRMHNMKNEKPSPHFCCEAAG